MASEVNHHVGYSRENECWFVRFYPYQTEQQASEAAAAFTRPAPAATVTGLVTVAWQHQDYDEWHETRVPKYHKNRGKNVRELVTRSQAEELLAAKDKLIQSLIDFDSEEVKRLEAKLEVERAEKEIAERNRDAARENFLTMQKSAAKLLERAEKAEADNAALIHDLTRIKDHETELVNDNAAMDARIKELETELENGGRVKGVNTQYANALAYLEMTEDDDPEEFAKRTWDERKALEAKLAAAEKALETYRSTVKDVCESQRGTKWGKTAECIFDAIERAVLGGKP